MNNRDVSDTGKNKAEKSVKMAYKPSGKCPINALFLMVLLGIVGSAVSGIFGYGMSVFSTWSLNASSWKIAQFGSILWWYLLTPFLMSVIIVAFISIGVGKGKCRKPSVALVIGIFAAFLSYFLLVGFMAVFNADSELAGHGMDVSHTFRVIAVVVVTALAVRQSAKEPYCEKCNNWMKADVPLTTSVDLTDKIVSSIQEGAFFDNINNFSEAFDKKNNCKVERWLCPNCGNGFINVTKKIDNNEQMVLSLSIIES